MSNNQPATITHNNLFIKLSLKKRVFFFIYLFDIFFIFLLLKYTLLHLHKLRGEKTETTETTKSNQKKKNNTFGRFVQMCKNKNIFDVLV